MSPEEMARNITYLMDRQAIYDVVASYCRGVDRFDRDLVMSVYHEDALDDHSMFVGNREDFYSWMQEMHDGSHISTQHMIGNHLAEIDGDVAHAETYFMWGGMNRMGAPFSFIGGRYIDRLEKRNGKWAIVARNMVNDWFAPSINTEEGAKTPEGATNFGAIAQHVLDVSRTAPKAARDRSDPSYARPLAIDPHRLDVYKEAIGKHHQQAAD